MSTTTSADPRYDVEHDTASGTLRLRLNGTWTVDTGLPPGRELVPLVQSLPRGSRVVLEDAGIGDWDSLLVAFARTTFLVAMDHGVSVDASGLPEGARKLLDLAAEVPPKDEDRPGEDDALTARVGRIALGAWDTVSDATEFLGEVVQAFGTFLRGRARFRRVDLMHATESAGVGALGIVALINFLVGTVLAFVGAVQLEQFGATIYVANLVGIAVARVLGALMTGIVMSGRTGASFAAVLGTMNVNEETDALQTMGLKPVEFLVLPRVLATTLMLPALTAYAILMGMLGGMFVGVTLLRIGPIQYLTQTQDALDLRQVVIGLSMGLAFGMVVALTGCYYGLRCGRSSAAVGQATTKAVVSSIVLVVVVTAVFTVILYLLEL
ncbi:MAG: ABC transporter permease [Acidobacteria bacterium]|jgi:phospholipid/cholesterol/gamma-HCH transport system permease protein|nr:ABC transporter permease [Acidobacteriota bacterium]